MVNLNNVNPQPSVSSVLIQAASAGSIKSSVKAAISESTIAQAKSVATPSTQVNISPQGRAASSNSDTQNHAVNGNSPSGAADSSAWVSTPLNIIDIDYKKGEAERLRLAQTYEVDPTHKAQDATYALANRMASLQATIDKTHPELSNASWDFVLKDGKIEVTGNVSASNKTWLEGKLNGDLKVVQAAKDLYSAVVTRFQYTADNANPKAIGADIHGYFDNVAAHVNGNIKMRELVRNELGVDALNGVFRSGTSSSVEMDHIARQYLSVSSSPPKFATSVSNSTSAQTSPTKDNDSSTAVTPSTQVSISAQGMAASLASAPQNATHNESSTSSASDSNAWLNTPLIIVDIDYKKGEAEQQRLYEIYTAAPGRKASDATFTLANRIAALQTTIDKTHPELAKTNWDFVLNDGKIQVTGNVSAADKTWLEGKLNGDPKMVKAAKDLYSSMVTTFQYTAENKNPVDLGWGIHGYFDKVADHINGNIHMRDVVKTELGVDALHGIFRSGTMSDPLYRLAKQYLSVSSGPPKQATSVSNSTSSQTSPSNDNDSSTAVTPSTRVGISTQGLAASMPITDQGDVDPTLALRSTDLNSVVNKATQATPVDYKKGAAELQRRMETYIAAPTRKASDATLALANQIAALQPTIDKTHPELAKTNWDFVLKDGKIQVTGNVSAADKTWLEGKLNGDPKMVKAAKDLYSSVVTTFQYTADNNFGRGIGWGIHGYFDKVADHINGNIQMRDLVKTELGVDALRGVFKSGTLSDPLNRIAKQYLSVSNSPPKQAMA